MSVERTVNYMYSKGFKPNDIVYWIDHDNKTIEVNKVISIKMAKYLYKIKYNKNGERCTVSEILRNKHNRNPIFLVSMDEDGKTWPGWMSEEDLFKLDKAAMVLYGSKETINSARRLARKR